jgi:hypothetical protein
LLDREAASAAQFDIEITERLARRIEKRIGADSGPGFVGVHRGWLTARICIVDDRRLTKIRTPQTG